MFFDLTLLSHQLLTGTMAGLGHSFGQNFFPWLVRSWGWLRNRKQKPVAELPNGESLLRRVDIAEVATGIPQGFQLCRYKSGRLIEKYLDKPPQFIEADESLWLIPTGAVTVTTGLKAAEKMASAQVSVVFNPDDGLASLLTDNQELNRGWLEGLIAGGVIGMVNSLSQEKVAALVNGEASAAEGCLTLLNKTLGERGIRCMSIDSVAAVGGVASGLVAATPSNVNPPAELTAAIGQIRSKSEWNQLVSELQRNGLPVEDSTQQQLDKLRDELLAKIVTPKDTVNGLAEITAEAFERAGIERSDLQRWQTVSDRLADFGPEEPAQDAAQKCSTGSSVVKTSRPSTWLAWDRYDVDRRLLRYTCQTVRHCRMACDDASTSVEELALLRQIRGLKEKFDHLEELLATVPSLQPRTSSLRLDGHAVKTLIKSLEQAVVTSEKLSSQVDQLFMTTPTSTSWTEQHQTCLKLVSQLTQLVQDRRSVR